MNISLTLYKAIARLRFSEDGVDLLEYLKELSNDNYKKIKYCEPEMRDINIGRAQAIDEIKDFILNADIKAKEVTLADPSEWSL